MLGEDEDAVICDFAETYHIYDIRALPPETAAILAAGLREGSRIHSKLSGISCSNVTYLLTAILDSLRTLIWMNTKDVEKGRNQPRSMTEKLIIKPETEQVAGFDSIDEFNRMRAEILGV